MKRAIFPLCTALLLLSLGAHGADPEATASSGRTSEVQSPVQIDYRVIGTPIVGQAIAVELQLRSSMGTQPYSVTYRVNDATAMQLPESQSATVSVAPAANDERSSQQVSVIPLREGRLYLNVAAVVETESGSMQTVIAIPIQVGPEAPREFLENGTVTTDADGNLIRSLPASEN